MNNEQRMREQFDAFVYERTVNRNMSWPWPTPTELAWLARLERDAEVQRLVAALTSMVVEFDPDSENEIAAHENAVMLLAEYLPEKEVADAD